MPWFIIVIFIIISFILICANVLAKHSDEKMKEIMKRERQKKE